MSALRIQKIDLKSFKAFLDLSIPINGRNLLIYGKNGAGKSSIYWALYTFLQSAQKNSEEVFKYFDAARPENLINRFTTSPDDASIAVSFQNEESLLDSSFTISKSLHETKDVQKILNGDLASDFITYRILFSFYHYRNSQTINLWKVFEDEMLPFCKGDSVKEVHTLWGQLKGENPFDEARAAKEVGYAAGRRYNRFDVRVNRFNTGFKEVLARITTEAQAFYEKHFVDKEEREPEKKITVGVGLSLPAKYDRKAHKLIPPKVSFEVKLGPTPLPKPHSFLNEAKLTQLALSVRFGATLAQLQESPIKLLVLDDLLISLDMSNRMKVVDIILSKTFADYQKIILTHDKGFYSEIRRRVGFATANWSFQRLHVVYGKAPTLSEDPEHITWATSLMKAGRYDEAALQLRKAAEDFLRDFVKKAYSTEKFISLSEMLEDARRQTDGLLLKKLFAVLEDWDTVENVTLDRLLPPNMDDITGDGNLSERARQQLCRRRASLRSLIKDLHGRHRETGQILEQIEHVKDRILNPAAHAGEAPLYQAEVEAAIELITKLRNCLP